MKSSIGLRGFLLGIALLGVSCSAFAQGCAMCLMSAMSQGAAAVHALNLGVWILLVPPVVMIVAVLVFTFLRRFH